MNGIRRIFKILCLVIMLIFAAAFILHSGINIKSKMTIDGNFKSAFYDIELFKKQYILQHRGINILTLKLLEFGEALKLDKLKSGSVTYVLCSSGSGINIYSSDGCIVSSYTVDNKAILSTCTGDINKDGTDEILMITGKFGQVNGDSFSVLCFKDKFTLLYEKSIENLKPWKVQVCDVDGDKKPDISIGVYKTTLFHPEMSKRPFIYNWENGFISPKWLGSRLSQPFDDYVFCDVDQDGMDEIAAVENTEDNKKIIGIYKWKGFGVELMASGEKYDDMEEILTIAGNRVKDVAVKAKFHNKWRWYTVTYNNGKVFLNKRNGIINSNVY